MAFVLHTSLVILCTIKGSHEFDLVGFFLPAMKCGTTTLQWLVNCDFRIYYAQIQTGKHHTRIRCYGIYEMPT